MGVGLELGLRAQTKPRGLHGGHHHGILKPYHGGLRPHNHFFESRSGPPQYHMSTHSAIHQVIGSGHLLDKRLWGYSWGLVPWVPQVTGYGPTTWI
jgi:hypothetical protein